MNVDTGKFHNYKSHHKHWFQLYYGHGIFEVWVGNRWVMVML